METPAHRADGYLKNRQAPLKKWRKFALFSNQVL
jgi:hypothetical protein